MPLSETLSNISLSHKFRLLKFRLIEGNFSFTPGQFITLKVDGVTYRSYSIFSSPQELPYWEILVDITPQGPGTKFLNNIVKETIIETSEPQGTFHLDFSKTKYIFAATGCGIAPLKPMMEYLINNNSKQICLYWGLTRKRDVILEGIFKKWSQTGKFNYNIIFSQPDQIKNSGHITTLILREVEVMDKKLTSIYLSGSADFIQETIFKLSQKDFSEENINFEQLYFSLNF